MLTIAPRVSTVVLSFFGSLYFSVIKPATLHIFQVLSMAQAFMAECLYMQAANHKTLLPSPPQKDMISSSTEEKQST